jgi:methylated-DNA-[protein]-cysteine S-methyltransferase
MRKTRLASNEPVFFSLYHFQQHFGVVISTRLGLIESTLPSAVTKDEILATLHKQYAQSNGENELTRNAAITLVSYFSRIIVDFDYPLDTRECTAFQNLVYRAVQGISYGTVKTYGQIAREIHRPKAARGVGSAMARNRLPIIIPCHRVIGSTGAMTGYSAPGGTQRKEALLRMESAVFQENMGMMTER